MIFADRKPGAYQADITLPATLANFKPASLPQGGAVACAKTEILHFQSLRRPR